MSKVLRHLFSRRPSATKIHPLDRAARRVLKLDRADKTAQPARDAYADQVKLMHGRKQVTIFDVGAWKMRVRVNAEVTDSKLIVNRGIGLPADATPEEIQNFATVEEIKAFIAFFIKTPIGPSLLTLPVYSVIRES